jgi:hypothetical protein
MIVDPNVLDSLKTPEDFAGALQQAIDEIFAEMNLTGSEMEQRLLMESNLDKGSSSCQDGSLRRPPSLRACPIPPTNSWTMPSCKGSSAATAWR